MGCEDGQESRLIELGRIVDARAREILDKFIIGDIVYCFGGFNP